MIELRRFAVTKQLLADTGAGKVVRKAGKHIRGMKILPVELADLADDVVQIWRKTVFAERNQRDAVGEDPSGAGANGANGAKCAEESAKQPAGAKTEPALECKARVLPETSGEDDNCGSRAPRTSKIKSAVAVPSLAANLMASAAPPAPASAVAPPTVPSRLLDDYFACDDRGHVIPLDEVAKFLIGGAGCATMKSILLFGTVVEPPPAGLSPSVPGSSLVFAARNDRSIVAPDISQWLQPSSTSEKKPGSVSFTAGVRAPWRGGIYAIYPYCCGCDDGSFRITRS